MPKLKARLKCKIWPFYKGQIAYILYNGNVFYNTAGQEVYLLRCFGWSTIVKQSKHGEPYIEPNAIAIRCVYIEILSEKNSKFLDINLVISLSHSSGFIRTRNAAKVVS